MFQHWPKRTKVLMGIFVGVLALAIGVGAWGYSTGKLGAKADTYIFPGTSGGKVIGTISASGVCAQKLSSTYIDIYKTSNGVIIGKVKSDATGHFEFRNVPLNTTYMLAASARCGPTSGGGGCDGFSSSGFSFTSNGQSKNVTVSLNPTFGSYKVLTKERKSNVTQASCTQLGGTWYTGNYCVVSLGGVNLRVQESYSSSATTPTTDSLGRYPGGTTWKNCKYSASWTEMERGIASCTVSVTASKTGYSSTTAQSGVSGCTNQEIIIELKK